MSYGLVNGSGPLVPGGVSGVVKDNVFVGGRNISGEIRGIGMEIANANNVSIEKNIFTKTYAASVFAAINLSVSNNEYNPNDAVGLQNLTVQDNIVYKWNKGIYVNPAMRAGGSGKNSVNNLLIANNDLQETVSSNLLYHGIGIVSGVETVRNNRYYTSNTSSAPFYLAGRTYTMAAWVGTIEPTAQPQKANYVDPERDVKTYSFTLGGNGTNNDFLSKAKSNGLGIWNPKFTAAAANAYIRAGFVDRGDVTPAIPADYIPTPTENPDGIGMPPVSPPSVPPVVSPPVVSPPVVSPPVVSPPTSPPPVSPPTSPPPASPPPPPPPTSPPPPPNPSPNTPPSGDYTVVVGPDGKVTIVYGGGGGSPPTSGGGSIPDITYVNNPPGGSPTFGNGYWYTS